MISNFKKNYKFVNKITKLKKELKLLRTNQRFIIQEVKLPEGIRILEEYDLNRYKHFKKITIPDSVKKIGYSAFAGCTSLESITIPDSVEVIGSHAFKGCTSLESITIPDSVEVIDYYAFEGCTGLKNINIPDSVKAIGGCAFVGCTSLESITIPDSVEVIDYYAFEGCTSLKNINIPDSIKVIGSHAFAGCTSLESITIPDSVEVIGRSAFEGCTSLESITIPDSVKAIDDYAFEGCTSLESITIPDSVKAIGAQTFAGCTSLESITIPDSVEVIGRSAFEGCTSLKNINIPDSVKVIGSHAFAGCTSLESITIPDSVKAIGAQTFAGCTSLESITIPDSVEVIDYYAFEGCTNLKNINIPDSVKAIDDYAFVGCTSLESITIPDSVEVIGAHAFKGCTNLKNITIPDSVKAIDDYTFAGCTSLESITIPDSVEVIGAHAFEGCTNLKSITIFDMVIGKPDSYSYVMVKGAPIIVSGSTRELEINPFAHYSGKVIVKKYNIFNDKYFYKRFFSASSVEVYGIPLKRGSAKGNDAKERFIACFDLPEDTKEEQITKKVLENIIINTPIEHIAEGFCKKMDFPVFKENVSLLVKYGFDEQTISEFFLQNRNFLGNSFESVISNFNHLLKQNISDEVTLKKVFFDIDDNSELGYEKLLECMKEYFSKNNSFLPLLDRLAFKVGSDKEELDLRDSLLYVSHMGLLNDLSEDKINIVRNLLKKTVFENIVKEDKDAFDHLKKKYTPEYVPKYDLYFDGIKSSLYSKLNGLSENTAYGFLNSMNENHERFNKFIESLYVVENWNQYSSKERATLLKNEIVGRLLYSVISLSFSNPDDLKRLDKKDIYNNLKKAMEDMSFNSILEIASDKNKLYKNDEYIKLMLKIDPYSFDSLRSNNHHLEYEYCLFAKECGYLFSNAEKEAYLNKLTGNNKIKFNCSNKFTNYIEYINNEIGISKIPEKYKSEYLRKTRVVMEGYLSSMDDGKNNLFDLLRLTDLYLRDNNGYITFSDKEGAYETANKVFDPVEKIGEKDRLMHMMYYLNRLAHNTTDINLCVDYVNDRLGDKLIEEKMKKAIKRFNNLESYGMDFELVMSLVKIRHDYSTNEIKYTENQKRIKGDTLDSKDALIATLQDQVTEEFIDKINSGNIDKIRLELSELLELSENGLFTEENIQKLKLYTEERKLFFDVKAIVAEELLNFAIDDMGNEICEFIDMNKKQKQEFYSKNGYIMEVQKDANNNQVLLCYSKQFRETFSIHLVNLSPKLKRRIDEYVNSSDYEETLAHTVLNPPGLTLRDKKFELYDKTKGVSEIISGGFKGKDSEYSVSLYNYLTYDLYSKTKELQSSHREIKRQELKETWVDCFENIDVLSFNGGKNILTTITDNLNTLPHESKVATLDKSSKLINGVSKRKYTISSETAEVLKELNLNFGSLKSRVEESDEIRKK